MKVYIYRCEIVEIPDYESAHKWVVLTNVPNISDYSTVEKWIQSHQHLEKPIARLQHIDGTVENLVVAEKEGPLSNYIEAMDVQIETLLGNNKWMMHRLKEEEAKNVKNKLYNDRFRSMNFIQRLRFLLTKKIPVTEA